MKPCKDCKAEWERRGQGPPKVVRPAPYPGPRCATHDRQRKRATKAVGHERRVQSEYGLKPGEYGALYLFQGGVCYICQRATGKTRRLSVDHDHKCCPTTPACGKCIRGLVCRPCNDMLGHLRDSVDTVMRVAAYLLAPPMRQLREREDG